MPHIINSFQKIAQLAHLELDTDINQLENDVQEIINYVEQLRQVNTQHIEPLQHPLDTPQPLRTDHAIDDNLVTELGASAPLFQDNLYLVPTVISTGI
jgi:aspartyl-tRNA(Asn)/glutamyl-tRNA(Gln) amidotransferase subunit C